MTYHFKYHKEGKKFWAQCVEIEGCITQADTIDELNHNMHEALNLILEEPADSPIEFPEPRTKMSGRNVVSVDVEPSIAFALLLKWARKKKKMTQRAAADALDMPNIYSYQTLESPKKANPELKTLVKLKAVFPDLDIDQVFKKAK